MDFALIHKDRRLVNPNNSESIALVGDVINKTCILIDDIADTSFTICNAAELLQKSGATKIYALLTHAILSNLSVIVGGNAIDMINESCIDEVVVTNSVPQDEHVKQCKKIKTIDVSLLLSEAIRRIHNGESVSFLFDEVDL